ncbi:MAG: hypothetical protein JWP97_6746 [Labilithrix sp.]|nr:hypothetical protein [Labilithrix sp.]
MNSRRRFLSSALLVVVASSFAVLGAPRAAHADGMIFTGDGVRTKSIGPFSAKVYSIRHDMKERPAAKSKQAVIEADVDKVFTWKMLRDVDTSKIKTALREAFQMNGYGDQSKIAPFVGAFSQDEIKENSPVSISYSAVTKSVTITVGGGGKATIPGVEFMKAVWSIWLGKIDPPSLGDQLISKL